MRVLICGSRTIGKCKAMLDLIEGLPKGTIVIAGGAKGADTWAEEAAKARGLEVKVFKPDWDKHGKAAGFIRNEQMLREGKPHWVHAFYDGQLRSKGTAHTMKLASERKYNVEWAKEWFIPEKDQIA